jgi:AraC family transcriptional regulator, regulatory protein of adaptative response / DNA-3-methyladenine glycosylase II
MTSADTDTQSLRDAIATPVDPAPLLGSLVGHAVPGVEEVTVTGHDELGPAAGTVRRLVTIAGSLVPVRATLAHGLVTIEAEGLTPALLGADDATRAHLDLRAAAARWFGLDDDLAVVRKAFERDPLLGPLVSRRPDLRILGHLDGFEAAATTVLGQQVSLAATRVFGGRLAAAYGRPGPGGLLAYPGPSDLAELDPTELKETVRITHARARTLVALARAAAEGLELHPTTDPVHARERLLALPGIGPWTADYLALRVLADRDAYPVGDLVLRRALDAEGPREVAAAGEPWRPWRAYATVHLWTSRVYGL